MRGLVAFFLSVGAAYADGYRPPKLPVRELLDAMKAVDQAQDALMPAPSAQIISNYVMPRPSKGGALDSENSGSESRNV